MSAQHHTFWAHGMPQLSQQIIFSYAFKCSSLHFVHVYRHEERAIHMVDVKRYTVSKTTHRGRRWGLLAREVRGITGTIAAKAGPSANISIIQQWGLKSDLRTDLCLAQKS